MSKNEGSPKSAATTIELVEEEAIEVTPANPVMILVKNEQIKLRAN